MKVSIVIPTITLDLLQTCMASILEYTSMDDLEIIVVANGAHPAMWDYTSGLASDGYPVSTLWYKKAIGAVPALNAGIKESTGDFIILLNDDTAILESPKNAWIETLMEPFKDPKVMATGPLRMRHVLGNNEELTLCKEDSEYGFLVFFLAMIRRQAFDELGLLDESLTCGVDSDFCMKLRRKSYLIQQVPTGDALGHDGKDHMVGNFPIWHEGEGTVHDFYGRDKWNQILKDDTEILKNRYARHLLDAAMQIKPSIKTSIVIPTFGNSLDVLMHCVDSVIYHTNMLGVEIVVVANGCPESVMEYLGSVDVNMVWFDQPIGFCSAINEGVKVSKGEIVILLNHDTIILDDRWLGLLLGPFERKDVGITGPVFGGCSLIDRKFIMFFCAAVRKKVFDQIGLLDTIYNPGGLDDVDFCVRAEDAGWKLVRVPEGEAERHGPEGFSGTFPIHHMEHHEDWLEDSILTRNSKILIERYSKPWSGKSWDAPYTPAEIPKPSGKDVLCSICTKNRYDSTLPLAIQSVVMQTVKPAALVIYDDNTDEDKRDIRDNETYLYLLQMLDRAGIRWSVTWGAQKGQHYGHQDANQKKGYKYVWRLDDDELAEPDVLEKYLRLMKDDVGAVGGSCLTRGFGGPNASGKLEHIFSHPNVQWNEGTKVIDVDHLHSTFLYRAGIVNYNLELSPVAHREETIFTYELKLKGYRLRVEQTAITHHLRQSSTGIRSHQSAWFYQHDEKIFLKKMEEWGYKLLNLNCGIGDHYAFLNILPALKAKYPHLIIGACFPEVFKDHPDITLTHIAESEPVNPENIYKWMGDNKWKGSLVDAYATFYGVTS